MIINTQVQKVIDDLAKTNEDAHALVKSLIEERTRFRYEIDQAYRSRDWYKRQWDIGNLNIGL